MKYTFVLVLFLLISGCAVFQTHESSMTEPVLLKQAPIPPLPESTSSTEPEIYCEMLVGENGHVKRAKLLNSSGDEAWDLLAQQSFLKWEFSPALLDGEPMDIVIRRKIKVSYMEPDVVTLAEICCKDINDAKDAYKILSEGGDFSKVVKQYSVSPSKEKDGIIGNVDLRYYTKEIRSTLSSLSIDEFTKPVPYGDHYVIFKRLKDDKEKVQVDY